jgi:hypothetical protein
MDDPRNGSRDNVPGRGQILRFRQATPVPSGNGAPPSAGDLFGVLWRALVDILGTAAAATLLRRAAQGATPGWPELSGLSITREGLDYRYTVPPAWTQAGPPELEELRALALELQALLIDLTGSVVVNRLAQVPELRELGIVLPQEATP